MTDQTEHHLCKDGSSTLYSQQFGQFYHNPNGAISESKYVFFEASGLNDFLDSNPDSLTIFEVGFGTGLNFQLLMDEYFSKNLTFPVHYYSVEAFPINEQVANAINYRDFLKEGDRFDSSSAFFSDLKEGMNALHPFIGSPQVHLNLFYGLFNELESIDHQADFIFHDPFSPEVNEELWTVDTFMSLRKFSKTSSILATYCAASKARAAMAKSGWFVFRAPGALGKREMTVASLNEESLKSHKRINEQRLIERYDNGDFSVLKS